MGFSMQERKELRKLKHVSDFVIDRLEECGYASLFELKKETITDVIIKLSPTIDSGAWKPTDRERAVAQVLNLAKVQPKSDDSNTSRP